MRRPRRRWKYSAGCQKENPEGFLLDFMACLSNLGNLLYELGRKGEALNVIQEAVEKCRQLTISNPDVFLPDLAEGFDILETRFSELGQEEEALRAAQEADEIRK